MQQQRRVVVADADPATRNLVQVTLASDRWVVTEADDAPSAIQALARHVPDVLVIDADLPPAGGLATARALRGQPQTAGIRVLLLTDLARPVALSDLEASRVDATIARPFGAFALLAAIEDLLDADESATADTA